MCLKKISSVSFKCRQPIPVCLTHKGLKGELERAKRAISFDMCFMVLRPSYRRGLFLVIYCNKNWKIKIEKKKWPLGRSADRPHQCYDFYTTSYFSPFLSLLPPVAERSWYTVISSYLSITTYCLLRRSIAQYGAAMHSLLTHAQSAYLCTARTARLPTRSLLVQYIRTLWTLTFSS